MIEGRDGWPEAYEYRVGGSVRRFAAEADGPGLLHLKLFHPLDDHLGFPPLAAAQVALDLSNAAATWNKALLDNSARPSGALVYQPKEGGNLSRRPVRAAEARNWTRAIPARCAPGGRCCSKAGSTGRRWGFRRRTWISSRRRNGAARDIALAFGVPPMLLGIPGDNTYANYQEANRAFYRLTVLPMLTRTAASLSAWLSGAYGEALRLEPDLDKVAGLAARARRALGAGGGARIS